MGQCESMVNKLDFCVTSLKTNVASNRHDKIGFNLKTFP